MTDLDRTRAPSSLGRFLREPLVHFLVLGALLFFAYARFGKNDEAARPKRIVAKAEDVRTEILVREALALGLDRDDPAIRDRLVEKMETLLAAREAIPEPSAEDLEVYLDLHRATFHGADATRPPTLEEIRSVVRDAWIAEKKRAVVDRAVEEMKRAYEIVIEDPNAGKKK